MLGTMDQQDSMRLRNLQKTNTALVGALALTAGACGPFAAHDAPVLNLVPPHVQEIPGPIGIASPATRELTSADLEVGTVLDDETAEQVRDALRGLGVEERAWRVVANRGGNLTVLTLEELAVGDLVRYEGNVFTGAFSMSNAPESELAFNAEVFPLGNGDGIVIANGAELPPEVINVLADVRHIYDVRQIWAIQHVQLVAIAHGGFMSISQGDQVEADWRSNNRLNDIDNGWGLDNMFAHLDAIVPTAPKPVQLVAVGPNSGPDTELGQRVTAWNAANGH